MNFVLHPENIVILGGYGAPLSVRIEFSQNFGGDAEIYSQFMMFNISPTELWIDNERSEDFSQLVYHSGVVMNEVSHRVFMSRRFIF